MKATLLIALANCILSLYAAAGERLEQVDLRRVLREILPEMSFVAGDHSWNGGVQTNQVKAVMLQTSSAYLIFSDPAGSKPAQVAQRIRGGLLKQCELPAGIQSPAPPIEEARLWMRQTPEGVPEDEFAEAYYHSGAASSEQSRYTCFSVRVVRLAPGRLGISLTYASLE